MRYEDRKDAGRKLAESLRRYKQKDSVVLALPRGGVVLGAELATEFSMPLGVILVRKIGHPSHPEYAIGALIEGEEPVYNRSEVATAGSEWLSRAEDEARKLIARRHDLYYDEDVAPPLIKGRPVIIVDDGIATGLTMKAAVLAMKNQHVKHITVAVPVAPKDSVDMLKTIADEVIVLDDPERFLGAVGAHYRHFDQVDDEEVRRLLKEASYELHQAAA